MWTDKDESFANVASMQARARDLWDEGWMVLRAFWPDASTWCGYSVFRPRADGSGDDAFMLRFAEGADRKGDPKVVYANLPPRRIPYPG